MTNEIERSGVVALGDGREAEIDAVARAIVPYAYGVFELCGTNRREFIPGEPNGNAMMAAKAAIAALARPVQEPVAVDGLVPTVEQALRIQLAALRRERDALEMVISARDTAPYGMIEAAISAFEEGTYLNDEQVYRSLGKIVNAVLAQIRVSDAMVDAAHRYLCGIYPYPESKPEIRRTLEEAWKAFKSDDAAPQPVINPTQFGLRAALAAIEYRDLTVEEAKKIASTALAASEGSTDA